MEIFLCECFANKVSFLSVIILFVSYNCDGWVFGFLFDKKQIAFQSLVVFESSVIFSGTKIQFLEFILAMADLTEVKSDFIFFRMRYL